MIAWISERPWVVFLALALMLAFGIRYFLGKRSKDERSQIAARAAAVALRTRDVAADSAREHAQKRAGDLPPAAKTKPASKPDMQLEMTLAMKPGIAGSAKSSASSASFSARAPMHSAASDDVDLQPLEFSSAGIEPPSSLPSPAGASLLAQLAQEKSLSRQAAPLAPQSLNRFDELPPLEFVPSGIKNPPPVAKSSQAVNTASKVSAPAIVPTGVAAAAKPVAAVPIVAVAKAPVAAIKSEPGKDQAAKDQLSSNEMPFDDARKFEHVSFVDDFLALSSAEPDEIEAPLPRRIQLAQRGEFRVVKVVQDEDDGEKTLHFELYRGQTLLKQGAQAEIQAEAKRAMAAG